VGSQAFTLQRLRLGLPACIPALTRHNAGLSYRTTIREAGPEVALLAYRHHTAALSYEAHLHRWTVSLAGKVRYFGALDSVRYVDHIDDTLAARYGEGIPANTIRTVSGYGYRPITPFFYAGAYADFTHARNDLSVLYDIRYTAQQKTYTNDIRSFPYKTPQQRLRLGISTVVAASLSAKRMGTVRLTLQAPLYAQSRRNAYWKDRDCMQYTMGIGGRRCIQWREYVDSSAYTARNLAPASVRLTWRLQTATLHIDAGYSLTVEPYTPYGWFAADAYRMHTGSLAITYRVAGAPD
jgi:hypothetical protein